MRTACLVFGAGGGVCVVTLTGYHGFGLGDTRTNGAIMGVVFVLVALGALGGPAAASHAIRRIPGWRKLWGFLAAVVVLALMFVHGLNSLDALVTRMDRTAAARSGNASDVRDDRAQLARLVRERDALNPFAPTTDDAVRAAREAVTAAQAAAHSECDVRGKECRKREDTEARVRAELAAAISARAATARAARLDVEVATVRARLAGRPPAAAANPWAEAVERLLHIPAADADTIRWFFMVAVIEMAIATSLLLWETLPPAAAGGTPRAPVRPAKPAPVEARRAPAAADVGRFVLACLPKIAGAETTLGAVFGRYQRWCAEQSPPVEPMTADAFGLVFKSICDRHSIRTERRGGKVYALNVRLAA